MQVNFKVDQNMETCNYLDSVLPNQTTSAPGLQMLVTSQIPSVPLPFCGEFWQATIGQSSVDDELAGTSPRRVQAKSITSVRNEPLKSLPFPSVPLPFPFRYAGKVDDSEKTLGDVFMSP